MMLYFIFLHCVLLCTPHISAVVLINPYTKQTSVSLAEYALQYAMCICAAMSSD